MSSQSKTTPMLELKTYIRIVAAVFCISSATALVLALLRLLYTELFYLEPLFGSDKVVHYIISGLMVVSSSIGFLNSCVMLNRPGRQSGRSVTTWLLLDSVFETSRVVYVFVAEVVLKGQGPAQPYELVVSAVQYSAYQSPGYGTAATQIGTVQPASDHVIAIQQNVIQQNVIQQNVTKP